MRNGDHIFGCPVVYRADLTCKCKELLAGEDPEVIHAMGVAEGLHKNGLTFVADGVDYPPGKMPPKEYFEKFRRRNSG